MNLRKYVSAIGPLDHNAAGNLGVFWDLLKERALLLEAAVGKGGGLSRGQSRIRGVSMLTLFSEKGGR